MKFGLNKNIVKQYWIDRSNMQKELTVGFYGHQSSDLQNIEYQEKINFVQPFIDSNLYTLDYGCGIGKWCTLFNSYIGVDITENLLNLAKTNYPDKTFIQLKTPTLEELDIDISIVKQIFTSTVLQHCDDDLVNDIFKSMFNYKKKNITFIFYENSQVKTHHVHGRQSADYIRLLSTYYNILDFESSTHIVHNEQHTITKIYC